MDRAPRLELHVRALDDVLERLDEADLARALAQAAEAVRNWEDGVEYARRELAEAQQWYEHVADEVRRRADGTTASPLADLVVDLRPSARAQTGDTPRRGATSTRGAILEVMEREPHRRWTPHEVHGELVENDPDLTPENVQVTMRRMAAAGEVVKIGRGTYRLPPPTNGDAA